MQRVWIAGFSTAPLVEDPVCWPVDPPPPIAGPPNLGARNVRRWNWGPNLHQKQICKRINPMMVTITRLYDDYATASQAVMDLEAAGVPSKDLSLIASNAGNWYETKTTSKTVKKTPKIDRDHDGVDDRVEGAEAGAGIGAVLAGGVGLLAGLGIMAIPGLGPVVAAGWL